MLVDCKKQIADVIYIQLDFLLEHYTPKLVKAVFE